MFRKGLILILISIIIFIILIVFVKSTKKNISKVDYYYKCINYLSNNIDYELIKKDKTNAMIAKCYFEGNDFAGFDSYPLSNDIDMFQMLWTLEIIDEIKSDLNNYNYYNYLKEHILPKIKFDRRFSELNNSLFISRIAKKLNYTNKYNYIKDILAKHYDKKNFLFFDNSIHDSIERKIVATYKAIEVIHNLNLEFYDYENICNKIISMYEDDQYFTYKDISKNIYNNGGLIISTLKLMNIDVKKLDKFQNRLNWVLYWNSKIVKILTDDIVSLMIIDDMKKINDSFNNKYVIGSEYLKDILDNLEFYNIGYKYESFNINTQYLYLLIKICNDNGYKFPFMDNIRFYVEDNIKAGFTKSSIPTISVIDNFYGLVLANRCNYKYNIKKVNDLLNHWKNQLEETNYSINSHRKVMFLYYLVLSYKEQRLKFSSSDIKSIGENIVKYINNISLVEKDKQKINIYDLRMCLEICKLLEYKIPNSIKKRLNKELKNIYNNEQYKDIISDMFCVTDLYLIINHLDLVNKQLEFINLIKNSYGNFYNGYAYKSRADFNMEPDVIATKRFAFINRDNNADYSKFLLDILNRDGYFKLSPNGDDVSLRYYFNACQISTY